MPTLITTQVQKWQGRLVRKGVQIQATDQEARILLALGRAKPAEETKQESKQEGEQKRAYKRKDIVKAPETVVSTPEPVRAWNNWPKSEE